MKKLNRKALRYLSGKKRKKKKYQIGGNINATSDATAEQDYISEERLEAGEAQAQAGNTMQALGAGISMIPGVGTAIGGAMNFIGNMVTASSQPSGQYKPVQNTNQYGYQYGGKMYANGGTLERLSGNAVKVDANNPGMTDSVETEEAKFDHGEVIEGDRVFTNSIQNPNSNRTFAKDAEVIQKLLGKFQKSKDQIQDTEYQDEKHLNKQSEALFNAQEQTATSLGLRNQDGSTIQDEGFRWGGNKKSYNTGGLTGLLSGLTGGKASGGSGSGCCQPACDDGASSEEAIFSPPPPAAVPKLPVSAPQVEQPLQQEPQTLYGGPNPSFKFGGSKKKNYANGGPIVPPLSMNFSQLGKDPFLLETEENAAVYPNRMPNLNQSIPGLQFQGGKNLNFGPLSQEEQTNQDAQSLSPDTPSLQDLNALLNKKGTSPTYPNAEVEPSTQPDGTPEITQPGKKEGLLDWTKETPFGAAATGYGALSQLAGIAANRPSFVSYEDIGQEERRAFSDAGRRVMEGRAQAERRANEQELLARTNVGSRSLQSRNANLRNIAVGVTKAKADTAAKFSDRLSQIDLKRGQRMSQLAAINRQKDMQRDVINTQEIDAVKTENMKMSQNVRKMLVEAQLGQNSYKQNKQLTELLKTNNFEWDKESGQLKFIKKTTKTLK